MVPFINCLITSYFITFILFITKKGKLTVEKLSQTIEEDLVKQGHIEKTTFEDRTAYNTKTLWGQVLQEGNLFGNKKLQKQISLFSFVFAFIVLIPLLFSIVIYILSNFFLMMIKKIG